MTNFIHSKIGASICSNWIYWNKYGEPVDEPYESEEINSNQPTTLKPNSARVNGSSVFLAITLEGDPGQLENFGALLDDLCVTIL